MLRILQLGCFGMDNLGDELSAQEIRRQIRLRWPHHDPEFTMVTRDPAHSARTHQDVKSFAAEERAAMESLRPRDFALVTLGGGTLLGSSIIRSARMFLRLRDSAKSNLFIWGCGVDPIQPGADVAELRALCSIAKCITVRNKRSADYLAHAGITDKVHVTSDPLFSVQIPARKHGSATTVTLCEKLLRVGRMQRRAALRALAQALDRHCRDAHSQIAFLPMRVIGHRKWRSDLEWAALLQRLLPFDLQVIRDNRPQTVLDHLAATAVYIGTRLHGCLLAAAVGCRVIGIGWEEKVRQLFDDIGLPEFLLSPADLRQPDTLNGRLETARRAPTRTISELRRRAESTVSLVGL